MAPKKIKKKKRYSPEEESIINKYFGKLMAAGINSERSKIAKMLEKEPALKSRGLNPVVTHIHFMVEKRMKQKQEKDHCIQADRKFSNHTSL